MILVLWCGNATLATTYMVWRPKPIHRWWKIMTHKKCRWECIKQQPRITKRITLKMAMLWLSRKCQSIALTIPTRQYSIFRQLREMQRKDDPTNLLVLMILEFTTNWVDWGQNTIIYWNHHRKSVWSEVGFEYKVRMKHNKPRAACRYMHSTLFSLTFSGVLGLFR